MAVRPVTLALENLESRLNLSTLAGVAAFESFSTHVYTRDRALLRTQSRLISIAPESGSRAMQAIVSAGAKTKATAMPLAAVAGATTPAPAVTASSTTKAITINWVNNSANDTGFYIERSTDGVNFTQIASVGAKKSTYTDKTAALGVSYIYRVTAYNKASSAESGASGAVSLALPPPPAAPTGLTDAKSTTSSIKLSWKDNATNETSYDLYRSTDGTNYTLVAALKANTKTYNDTQLAADITYYYELAASNAGGDTYASIPFTAATLAPKPSAPTGVALSDITGSSVTLAWADTSADLSGYRIYRSTNGKTFSLVGNVDAGTTTFTDTGLSALTKYSYEVSAWNSAANVLSKSASVSTLMAAPNAPESLSFTNVTTDSLTLSWVANSTTQTGFNIYRSTDGGSAALVGTVAADTFQFNDSNLNAGVSYAYTVAAVNAGGEGMSSAASVTMVANVVSSQNDPVNPADPAPVIAAPSAPAGLTVSNATSSSLTLTWTDDASNLNGVHVYRSTDGVHYTDVADLAATATSWSDTGLSAGTQYSYEIGAWNSAGETTSSAVAASTLVVAPGAPSGLAVSNVTSSGATLQWTDSGAITGYHVYRSTDGTHYTLVQTLSASQTSWSDTALAPASQYYYTVGAYNAGGETQAAAVSVSTLAVAPNAPGSVTFSNITTTGLTLNWSASASATGYHIYRSTDGVNYTLAATAAAGTTSWSDSGLSSGAAYSYEVGAFNTAGENKSAAASTTTQAAGSTAPITFSTNNETSFTELVITGTTGNDSIVVSQSGSTLIIVANGQTYTQSAGYGDMKIYGDGGNDTITVNSSVNIATLIYGGDTGNDTINNLTSGKATIVTIGNGTNNVTGNGVNTSYWVNPGDTVHASAAEIALGGVNRVASFYENVPRALDGQNLTDPTDSGTETTLANSSFWGTGPSVADVNQGNLSDCYFVAPLASLAYSEPLKLMNMGVDLGDGTYAIRFYRGNTVTYVRVDGDLSTGYWTDGLNNATPGADGNEWAPIFEKAYAFFRSGANTYASLNYGYQGQTFADLGMASSAVYPGTTSAASMLSLINTQLAAGHAIAASTNVSITSGAPIVGSHVYSVFGAYLDSSGNLMIELRNPWGLNGSGSSLDPTGSIVTIAYSVFTANFNMLNYTTA